MRRSVLLAVAVVIAVLGRDVPASQSPVRPPSKERAVMLLQLDRLPEALDVIEALVKQDAAGIPALLEAVSSNVYRFRFDRRTDYSARLRTLTALCRERLATLPREQEAAGVYELSPLEGLIVSDDFSDTQWRVRRQQFIKEYAGTKASLEAEVDEIGNSTREALARLREFAAAHPGTTAAAKAQYERGFRLRAGELANRDEDPAVRFFEVVAIVNELESGAYPPCRWVTDAPKLVGEFFTSDRQPFGQEHLDRVLAAYEAVVLKHFPLSSAPRPDSVWDYVITTKMAQLFGRQGRRVAGVERLLDLLEADAARAARARYLRASFYLVQSRDWEPDSDPAFLERGKALFRELQNGTDRPFAAAASEQLGALAMRARDDRAALAAYRQALLLRDGAGADDGWRDALRVAQAHEALGEVDEAIAAYQFSSTRFASIDEARLMGRVFAARLLEFAGRFDEARAEYRRALDAWGDDVEYFKLNGDRPTQTTESLAATAAPFTRATIVSRLEELESVSGGPDADLFERARAAVRRGDAAAAVPLFEDLLRRYPRSRHAAEAAVGLSRARLTIALQLVDSSNPARDEASGLAMLSALTREPYAFPAFAAKVALATWKLREQDQAGAAALLEPALAEWAAFSGPKADAVPPAAGTVERDVLEIRQVVFRPMGGGIFGTGGWNAFTWPLQPPPFVITGAEAAVRFPDRSSRTVSAVQPYPGTSKVLFLTSDQVDVFELMIGQIGGHMFMWPNLVVERPTQPPVPVDVLALWNRFFHARPGHWGGWEVGTYPYVGAVEFLNAERTKAAVAVGIGYSGATVLLEKRDGQWIATALVNQWVT